MTGPSRGTTLMTTGFAAVGSISSLTTKNVTVKLMRAFVDTDFTARAWILGDIALVGQIEVVPGSIVIVDSENVRVTVRNKSLVTVSAGEVYVIAEKN